MAAERNPPGRFSFSRRSLVVQLFALIILPLAVLVILVTFGSFTLHQQAMRSLVAERDQRAVHTGAIALQSEINHRTSAIHSLALRATSPGFSHPSDVLSSSSYLLPAFSGGLAFFTKQGNLVSSTGNQALWERLAQDKPPELTAALSQGNASPFISKPFPNPLTGQPIVLVSSASSDWFAIGAFSPQALFVNTLGGAFPTGGQTSVFVFDSTGQVLYQNGSLHLDGNPCNQPDLAFICEGQGGVTYTRMGGNEYVVAYSPIAPVGWGLVTEESWQSVESPLLQNTLLAPLVLIPVLLISLAALWFGARQVIRPLQKLEAEASQLSTGRFEEIEKPVGGIAEIRLLQEQLIQMARQVQAAQKNLHQYIGSITTGQEEERTRIARELHDDTIQSLIALKQRVQLVEGELQNGLRQQTLEIEALAEDTIDSLRRTIRALRPIYLEDLGLVTALEMLVKETEKASGLDIAFRRKGVERRLSPQVELALYRMAQEALNNVVRHANASRAELSIHFLSQEVVVDVQDNGKGFVVPKNPSEFAPGGHYGMLGLYERAELIGADLQIRSTVGQGTHIQVVVRR